MACRQHLLSNGEMEKHSYDEDVLEKFVDVSCKWNLSSFVVMNNIFFHS